MYLQTGQKNCYDAQGQIISCNNSGQDGAYQAGKPWPEPRFNTAQQGIITDLLTGLNWTRDANPGQFPLNWNEALQLIADFNQDEYLGHSDWRLPNRRELRSLICHQQSKPPLPENHPFQNIFQSWYWTSTTSAMFTDYAWYIHLQGARMFFGRKDQYSLVWPVRGQTKVLPCTGQSRCYDLQGRTIDCKASGQDAELNIGLPWPKPRFSTDQDTVRDRLTGLTWLARADLTQEPVSWNQALKAIDQLNARKENKRLWRLPSINELESLVDCSQHSPALPFEHPFTDLQEGYWSSTTSTFETSWAWVLYLHKGAVGVGHKPGKHFWVWPVFKDSNSSISKNS